MFREESKQTLPRLSTPVSVSRKDFLENVRLKPSRKLRLVIWAIVYLLVIVLAPLPDRLILFPTTYRIDPGSAAQKLIPFQNGNLQVWTARSALAHQPGQPEIFVLRFYGNADRADRWVAAEAGMWNERAVE